MTQQKLQSIIKHAYTTVPFYKYLCNAEQDYGELDIAELPVVNKKQMVESNDSLLSAHYIGKYLANSLKWTRTSGTSGILHEIYWDRRDAARSLKSLWILRQKYYDISPRQKLCYFYPSDILVEKYRLSKTSFAISRCVLYDGSLEEAYKKILEYEPEWMILQPSIALILCDLAKKYGVWESIQYIEFTGEYLEENVRCFVESVFRCKTANQYGTKEVNSIAFECPEHQLHIMSDNVYLETVDNRICVTSLTNRAMPFVKYQLEDRGEILRGISCNCGRQGDIVKLSLGRTNDLIKKSDGTTMHAYTLMQIIQNLNYQYEGCNLQYRIVQVDFDSFEFYLVIEDDEAEIKEILWRIIEDEVNQRIGGICKVAVKFVSKLLPEELTGKGKVFESKA